MLFGLPALHPTGISADEADCFWCACVQAAQSQEGARGLACILDCTYLPRTPTKKKKEYDKALALLEQTELQQQDGEDIGASRQLPPYALFVRGLILRLRGAKTGGRGLPSVELEWVEGDGDFCILTPHTHTRPPHPPCVRHCPSRPPPNPTHPARSARGVGRLPARGARRGARLVPVQAAGAYLFRAYLSRARGTCTSSRRALRAWGLNVLPVVTGA